MSLENVKNIVLILSGKGGVGKSSVTTQLALCLSLAGHSVGILDIDLTGPSIPRLLGIESAKVRQAPGGWLPVDVHSSQQLPPVPNPIPLPLNPSPASHTSLNANSTTDADGDNEPPSPAKHPNLPSPPIGSLQAMSLAFLLATRSSAIIWRGPKKTSMVRQFLSSVLWPPTDYLLIDTPPGTSDEHISLVESLLSTLSTPSPASSHAPRFQLAGAVIVTTPQAVAISDVKKELNFCGKTGVKVLGVVENMSGYVCECCGLVTNLFGKGGGEVMALEFGVPFLGRLPVDAQWGGLVEEGKRPRYGTNERMVGEAVDGDGVKQKKGNGGGLDAGGGSDGVKERGATEKGLLVEKYRSCSLFPIFQDIVAKVITRIEDGTAVTVKT